MNKIQSFTPLLKREISVTVKYYHTPTDVTDILQIFEFYVDNNFDITKQQIVSFCSFHRIPSDSCESMEAYVLEMVDADRSFMSTMTQQFSNHLNFTITSDNYDNDDNMELKTGVPTPTSISSANSAYLSGILEEKSFWGSFDFNKTNASQAKRLINPLIVFVIPPETIHSPQNTSSPPRHIVILDCGAGPLSVVGNWHPDFEIELIAVDPLAKFYNKLLSQKNIIPYPRVQYAAVEHVDDIFPGNFFDVVHIQNALDHSECPMDGINSMLLVLKPFGSIILIHYRNVATIESFVGLHQWNFDVNALEEFTITSKNNTVTNVNVELSGRAIVQSVVNDREIYTRIIKTI